MNDNTDKIVESLDQLVRDGYGLIAILMPHAKEEASEVFEVMNFGKKYQAWYSKSLNVIKISYADRLNEFTELYSGQKNRKEITQLNYNISDLILGVTITRNGKSLFNEKLSAFIKLHTQVTILSGIKEHFKDTLSKLSSLLEAEVFSREIDVASELAKKGHFRAAGAICGVLLERHLKTICVNHNIVISKKSPTISDMNDPLKNAGVIDVPLWRSIQFLGDIRNMCVHDKDASPTKEQIEDLISGTKRVSSTVF